MLREHYTSFTKKWSEYKMLADHPLERGGGFPPQGWDDAANAGHRGLVPDLSGWVSE